MVNYPKQLKLHYSFFITFQAEANGNLEYLVEVSSSDGVSEWTLLQQTFHNNHDNATVGFLVRGDLYASSTSQAVLAIDDFSLTSSACPLVST